MAFFRDVENLLDSNELSLMKSEIKRLSVGENEESDSVKKNTLDNFTHRRKPKITCGIITYNEERCIERCIESIIDKVDEVIVVDSMSSDKTIDIINTKFPSCRVIKSVWTDDFSKQRNIIFESTKNDWVIFLDADEYIYEPNHNILRNYIDILDFFTEENFAVSPIITDHNGHKYKENMRIVKNNGQYLFENRVHEKIRNKYSKEPVPNFKINFNIKHDGYLQSVFDSKKKIERNLTIEKKMLKESDDVVWHYYVARSLININDFDKEKESEAENHLLFFINYKKEKTQDNNFLGEAYNLISKLYLIQNRFVDLKNILKEFSDNFPGCVDILYYEIALLRELYSNQMSNFIDKLNDSTRKNGEDNSFINHNNDHLKLLMCELFLEKGNTQELKNSLTEIIDKSYQENFKNKIRSKLYSLEKTLNE